MLSSQFRLNLNNKSMHKSTWLHLRIPFGLNLVPIFMFSVSQYGIQNWYDTFLTFFALHLFLYPSTHGYNSYFDKDKGSIGGLKEPPEVRKELYYVSLIFELIAILIGLYINWIFAIMVFVLGLESKAYSHPSIRLKKYGILSLVITSLFQGGFIYLMVTVGLQKITFGDLFTMRFLFPAILCSITYLGIYPLTQIFQHIEDKQRGDRTLSLILGAKGTFNFSTFMFILSDIGFFVFFFNYQQKPEIFIFLQICLMPLMVFYVNWYIKFLKDNNEANYANSMNFQRLVTISISLFFGVISIV